MAETWKVFPSLIFFFVLGACHPWPSFETCFIHLCLFFFFEPECVKYQCDSIICRNFLNIYFLAPKVRVGVPSDGELEKAAGKADSLLSELLSGG